MLLISSLDRVSTELGFLFAERLSAGQIPSNAGTIRGPIGLFLVREDGAGGSQLAQEIVRSFGYWKSRSAHYFDGVFLGWGFDGVPSFSQEAFAKCVSDLEALLSWTYNGGAALLLTDFVFDTAQGRARLDFSRCISLDISNLMEKQKLRQLGTLIEELIAPVRGHRADEPETSVWEISDYVGALRTRRFFWEALIKKIGLLLGWADEVAPYAVRDLRKAT